MYPMKDFIEDSIRIYPHQLDKAKRLLDHAYFAIESDKQVVLDADRLYINDPKLAQQYISDALDALYSIEDEGCNKFDTLLGYLDRSIRDVQSLKIEVNVTPS